MDVTRTHGRNLRPMLAIKYQARAPQRMLRFCLTLPTEWSCLRLSRCSPPALWQLSWTHSLSHYSCWLEERTQLWHARHLQGLFPKLRIDVLAQWGNTDRVNHRVAGLCAHHLHKTRRGALHEVAQAGDGDHSPSASTFS